MKEREIFELENRRRIYNFILKHPGLHYREISRKLNTPKTTMEYHLIYLKKHDFIIAKSDGKYLRYYGLNKIGNDEKKIINIIRKETPRGIILLLLLNIGISKCQLSKRLCKSPRVVHFYIKKLMDLGVIERAPLGDGVFYTVINPKIIISKIGGNEIIYRLKNPEFVYNVLLRYEKSLLEDPYSRDVFDLIKFFSSDDYPEKRKDTELVDGIIKAAYDVFPHPYHI